MIPKYRAFANGYMFEVTDLEWRNGKIFRVLGTALHDKLNAVKGDLLGGHADYMDITKIKLMQFTSLHDKNGKEIYEGDIYRYTIPEDEFIKERRICQVVWDEDGWKGLIKGTSRICFIQNKYIEIIGNIHENPELLETHNGDKT